MSRTPIARFESVLEAGFRRAGVTRVCRAERAVRATEFGAIGLTGALLNAVAFLALVGRLSTAQAAFVAFFGAAVWTFGLNSRYTFETTDQLRRRFARYLGVCSLGYVVYTAVLTMSLQWLTLPYWLASLSAVTGGGLLNYVGSELFALA
ncbi:GtrA family protein [Halarchaeum sp. P4]|uniref:GtrA family protein n=1 Tax=Halarchaeum sp. P4 TaxID=3421639 RepID=UPI003EB7E076